jgi:hypothetical protein
MGNDSECRKYTTAVTDERFENKCFYNDRARSRFVSKTVLRNECSRCFYLYSLTQHVSAYLMAILKRIIQNIESSRYFYN